MSVVRISCALNRVRRNAGIAAHKTPPAIPASSMSGKAQTCPAPPKFSATQLPQIPPRVSCPSAPMFQTFARQPMAMPIAQSKSGVAFSASSARLFSPTSGSTTMIRKAATGGLPSSAKMMALATNDSTTATRGESQNIARDGLCRASSRNKIGLQLFRAVQSAHLLAHRLDTGIGRRHRGKQPPFREHRNAMRDLEQFREILGHDQYAGTLGGA